MVHKHTCPGDGVWRGQASVGRADGTQGRRCARVASPQYLHATSHASLIDSFWLRGWLIMKGAICTRTAPLFWIFISLFQNPRTRLVRKIGSQNQSITFHVCDYMSLTPHTLQPKSGQCWISTFKMTCMMTATWHATTLVRHTSESHSLVSHPPPCEWLSVSQCESRHSKTHVAPLEPSPNSNRINRIINYFPQCTKLLHHGSSDGIPRLTLLPTVCGCVCVCVWHGVSK